MREFFFDLFWEKKIAVFLIALAVLIAVGPFGTYDTLDFQDRFVYWTILMIGIGAFMHVFIATAMITSLFDKLPRIVRLIIGSALGAIPGVAILIFVNDVYRPEAVSEFNLFVKWFQVTMIGTIIGIAEFMTWQAPPPSATQETRKAQRHAPILSRLPPELGTDIISMSMQDHYVEVVTSKGSEVILLRFSDALSEVNGADGQRIHRSHWVAYRHVDTVKRDGHRHLLMTSDGRPLPVSATYADQLFEAINAPDTKKKSLSAKD